MLSDERVANSERRLLWLTQLKKQNNNVPPQLIVMAQQQKRAFFFLKTWTREGPGRVKKNNSCTPTKALLLLGLDDYP
ncbi:hypothetical protein OUZ56_019200 [Daphnia magna]|uniref:Uncharacterized protein n=1 Tax=Daphnia magna TaxID=35525 RepID=A0ABQ9ZAX8_9CRUS|nr:hypothetical protein OUZ56_019200 [Daphnia magna]